MTAADGAAPATGVLTIAAGVPFVDALAAGLLHQAGDDAAALARMRVLLPTRRACRALREAFLRRTGGRPLLLPTMTPLGDVEADDILFEGWQEDAISLGAPLAVAPAVSGLRRQLLLARMVMALPGRSASPEQAAALARELAALIDRVHTERADPARLADLAPDEFAEHWRGVLRFLGLVAERWTAVLAEENALDPAQRRDRLLVAQAEAWRARPPSDPVIAAGSTGSIPATADLLAVIASLPRGAVVLPGLDRDADDDAWRRLAPSHPQYGMARLLERLGVDRDVVANWPAPGIEAAAPARAVLLNAALAPAGAPLPAGTIDAAAATAGLTRIDCATPQEEAAVIALVMRHALETPGRTAALVTPDRGLARRVAVELDRWDLAVDDSAGRPLAATPPGTFLRLVAAAAVAGLAPVPLLALLKHPLAAAGLAPAECRRRARALENPALHGPRPAAGLAGLRQALACDGRGGDGQRRRFLDRLDVCLGAFVDLVQGPPRAPPALLAAQVAAAEALAASDDDAGPARLWAGDAGEAAARFVAELDDALDALPVVAPADWPALFERLMAGRVVRPRFGAHPRLFVWGLLEARLQRADVMVLGGLNEGTWPAEVEASTWMSRPMMKAFGLEMPERRIGLAAHDFVQAASAPEVFLTRAERVAGTPAVPSRWLMRLDNLLERLGHGDAAAPQQPWRPWAEALDEAGDDDRRVARPAPTPPVPVRPRGLSVTRVEAWIRDPYALYAEQVLNLRPLDPLDADPGAADRGTLIHEALHRFLVAHPAGDLPDDGERRLIEIGAEVFDEHLARPGVRAFWWPRFRRIAAWFVDWERQRREAGFRTLLTERRGTLEVPGPFDTFILTAKPDRIDHRADVGLAVVDYKTGTAPTAKQVDAGLAPQLSLEAAIAQAGGFAGLPAGRVAHLLYLRLTGGRQPGEAKLLALDVAEVAAETLERLRRRVAAFDDEATPYPSRQSPMFQRHYGDYDHLARVKEWNPGWEDTR